MTFETKPYTKQIDKFLLKIMLDYHNHILIMRINEFFAKYPKEIITKDEFMKIQLMQWKATKRYFNVKVRK